MENNIVVEKEVALNELRVFLEIFLFEELEDKRIQKDYPQVLSALMKGKLILPNSENEEDNPIYTLEEPVLTKTGVVDLTKVKFSTRITVSEKESIASKTDLRENPLGYSYACMAKVMNLHSKAYLDKFSRYDLKVCEQLSTLFV